MRIIGGVLALAGLVAAPARADTVRLGAVEPGPRVIALLDPSPQTAALGAALAAFGFGIQPYGRTAPPSAAPEDAPARYGVRAEAGPSAAQPAKVSLVDTLTLSVIAQVDASGTPSPTDAADSTAAYAPAASAIADVWMGP